MQSLAKHTGKLLVCVDERDYSLMAVKFACYIAKNTLNAIDLLHVIEPASFKSIGSIAEKMITEKRKEAEKMLQNYAFRIKEWGNITPSLLIREGLIQTEIIDTVKNDPDINMLIVGTTPESKKRSQLIPELTKHIGEDLPVPTLIVPENITEQQLHQLTLEIR